MSTSTLPLLSRMARITLEVKLLTAISQAPRGITLETLRERFKGEMVAHTVSHLEDREQIRLYSGVFYGLNPSGRARLHPPVCVVS